MKFAGYLRVGSNTALNILYAATRENYLLVGGQSAPGVFRKLG